MATPKHTRLTDSTITALAITALVAVLVLSIVGSYGLSLWSINRSQHQWCDTLSLLTSAGPPKPGTPSYNRALAFYDHLKILERRFGC